MTSVAQLIDRLKRDWLEPADSQPTRFTLEGAVTSTATTIIFDPLLMLPEESALLGPGSLIELESEEVIVGEIDESTSTLSSCIRGANGTTKAAHADGVEGFIAPTWRRKVMFDALGDAIVGLYPDLYKVVDNYSITVSSTSFTEVPAACMEPLYMWAHTSGSTTWGKYVFGADDFLDHFGGSTTGKAIQGAIGSSVSGYLAYKAQFTRPTVEADVLLTLGIDPQWERILLVDAAAYMVAGRELEQVAQERLTQQLAQAGFPALTATRIRQSLLQYRDQLVDRAQDAQRQREHTLVTVSTGL